MKLKIALSVANAVDVLTVGLVLLTSLLSCSSDPLTGPTTPGDYVVYFECVSPVRGYFGYHTVTGKIDTLRTPDIAIWGPIACSPDGHHLYIPAGDSVIVVNTQTQQVEDEIPYSAQYGLTPSPDGRYLALHGRWLRIVRLSDHTVIYQDAASLTFRSAFSWDSSHLYYLRVDPPSSVFRVDLEHGNEVTEMTFPVSMVTRVLLSRDESKLFLQCEEPQAKSFVVYDRILDSVLFYHTYAGESSDIVITPDERYVFISETGDSLNEEGSGHLAVFDTDANRIDRLIPTAGILNGTNPEGLGPALQKAKILLTEKPIY